MKTWRWSHPSVHALAGDTDPVLTIVERARDAVFSALEQGWSGPPFDPFELAKLHGIEVLPNSEIRDARIVPLPGKKVRIEFNPDRPRARVRYSLAHELAHTLFPDCADHIRNRGAAADRPADEWQLEALCNLGAAELLMPVAPSDLATVPVEIDPLMRLRERYDVSAEAILLRIVKLTDEPAAAFASTRTEDGRYRIEYAVASRTAPIDIPRGLILDADSVPAECTAIGFTAKRADTWPGVGAVSVECIGIASSPGQRYPRVVGVVTSAKAKPRDVPRLLLLHGDALAPRDAGPRIIAHVVNDKAAAWGGGFSLEVRRKWPSVQEDFRAWARAEGELQLGRTHLSPAEGDLYVFSMVAQHGYGPSARPRIRYHALRTCLAQLGQVASDLKATVHMPLIGAGQARGDWNVISELIEDEVCGRGIISTAYAQPGRRLEPVPEQPPLLGLAH